jgi:hypothetical protein
MPPLRSLMRLGPLASGLMGGAIGAGTAEPDENALLRGLGGAALGGIVGPGAIGSAARAYKRGGGGATGVADAASDWTYFSFLSSPDTILRASGGGAGGAVVGALEDLLEGVARGDIERVRQSGRIMKGLVGLGEDEGPRLYFKTLTQSPEAFKKEYRNVFPAIDKMDPEQHLTGEAGLGRMFAAADLVANKALRAGGRSAPEAARYTLTGQAKSALGKGLLEQQKRWRRGTPMERLVASQVMPFARVSLLGAEKGLEHTPLVGSIAHRMFYRTASRPIQARIRKLTERRARAERRLNTATSPAAKKNAQRRIDKLSQDLREQEVKLSEIAMPSTGRQLAQQAIGTGAGLASYEAEQHLDPRAGLVLGPLAGPAYLQARFGRELRRTQEAGEESPYLAALQETAQETSPLGFRPLAILTDFGREIPRRVIPSGVADIAEAMDPVFRRSQGRDAVREAIGRGELAEPTLGTSTMGVAAAARLPGFREELPEEFMPTDLFGQPRFQRQEVFGDPGPPSERNDLVRALSRMTFPGRMTAMPPVIQESNPNQAIFRELGLSPGAPSSRVNVPGLGVPLQQTAASAAAVARHRGRARELTGRLLRNMPALRNMPDGPQKRLLVGQITEMIQRQLSAALSGATLPTALSQGAQLPAWLRQPQ